MGKRIFGGRTSVSDGHDHIWFVDSKHTTIDDGHNHRICLNKLIALPNKQGGHSHHLLKNEY